MVACLSDMLVSVYGLGPSFSVTLKGFEHKCVLKVYVHIHPIIIKIHSVFFFINPCFKISFLKSGCSEISVRMT